MESKSRQPRSLNAYMHAYLEQLKTLNYAEGSIRHKYNSLHSFIVWCEERGMDQIEQITRPVIQRYQRHLHYVIGQTGKPLTVAGQRNRLTAVRTWFKFLMRENLVLYNPASELELPKQEKRLPKHVLTADEAERVLAQPDITTPTGLRDRAILELFYSTGIRRQEMINLAKHDINRSAGIMAVRQGKGKKDRFVPVGERALQWIDKYLEDVRPGHAIPSSPDNLFLRPTGEAMSPHPLSKAVMTYIKKSGVEKEGRCHLFRHTMATLMLENGADIRFIQQMLGHAMLSTTEIYTHVTIHKLKDIHTATHPARVLAPRHNATDEPSVEDLLAVLDDEAREEDA